MDVLHCSANAKPNNIKRGYIWPLQLANQLAHTVHFYGATQDLAGPGPENGRAPAPQRHESHLRRAP